jgi:hypothetical protein
MMQLKSKAEIEAAIAAVNAAGAFAAVGTSEIADRVQLCCAPYAAVYSEVNAIPIQAILTLALQLLPIIFGDGGFTIEKLTAILTLIQSIFQ